MEVGALKLLYDQKYYGYLLKVLFTKLKFKINEDFAYHRSLLTGRRILILDCLVLGQNDSTKPNFCIYTKQKGDNSRGIEGYVNNLTHKSIRYLPLADGLNHRVS